MNMKTAIPGLLLLVSLALAACGGSIPPAEVNAPAEGSATSVVQGSGPAPSAPEKGSIGALAHEEARAGQVGEPAGDAILGAEWFGVELRDVNTGETFTIAGLRGNVVLVETMAIWCPKCLSQQKEVLALREMLGERDDLIFLTLDVDPNESAESLLAYAAKHGFDWLYAIAPTGVAREIGQLYGAQFLNPPSTPMFIIDPQGEVHPLPFGRKSAGSLREALLPFLGQEP